MTVDLQAEASAIKNYALTAGLKVPDTLETPERVVQLAAIAQLVIIAERQRAMQAGATCIECALMARNADENDFMEASHASVDMAITQATYQDIREAEASGVTPWSGTTRRRAVALVTLAVVGGPGDVHLFVDQSYGAKEVRQAEDVRLAAYEYLEIEHAISFVAAYGLGESLRSAPYLATDMETGLFSTIPLSLCAQALTCMQEFYRSKGIDAPGPGITRAAALVVRMVWDSQGDAKYGHR
jgi:hypothetical protein